MLYPFHGLTLLSWCNDFFSFYSLYLKVYIVWYKYSYSSFVLVFICMEYISPSFIFSMLHTAYIWVFYLYMYIQTILCLLTGEFSACTFKVILVGVYLLQICSLFSLADCSSSSLAVFLCDLMIFCHPFSICFVFEFLLCGYHEVYI